MKTIISMIVALSTAFVMAESQVKKSAPLTEAEKAERRERMLKNTGGIIRQEGEGKIVVVNAQTRIADALIAERVENLHLLLKYNFEVRKGTWTLGAGKIADSTLTVYLVDDATLPMSLIAVEAGWGVLNTQGLSLGNRFSRELSRVMTLVIGAGHSQFLASPMQAVRSPNDLDKLMTDGFTMDSMTSIQLNTKKLGLTRYKLTSYKRACEEGWAPAPTNEYQKAIWDKVHAVPSKPIKIEFDPKKGR